DRLRQDDLDHGLCRGHAQGSRRLHLPPVHGLDRAAHDLRDVGCRIHPHAQHAADESGQQDAETGQPEEPDEQLHQQGCAPEAGQVDAARLVENPALRIQAADADEQTQAAGQQQRAHGDFDRHPCAAQQVFPACDRGREVEIHCLLPSNHLSTRRWYTPLARMVLSAWFSSWVNSGWFLLTAIPYSSVVICSSSTVKPGFCCANSLAAGLPVTAASARPISTRLNISWFFSTSTRCTLGWCCCM